MTIQPHSTLQPIHLDHPFSKEVFTVLTDNLLEWLPFNDQLSFAQVNKEIYHRLKGKIWRIQYERTALYFKELEAWLHQSNFGTSKTTPLSPKNISIDLEKELQKLHISSDIPNGILSHTRETTSSHHAFRKDIYQNDLKHSIKKIYLLFMKCTRAFGKLLCLTYDNSKIPIPHPKNTPLLYARLVAEYASTILLHPNTHAFGSPVEIQRRGVLPSDIAARTIDLFPIINKSLATSLASYISRDGNDEQGNMVRLVGKLLFLQEPTHKELGKKIWSEYVDQRGNPDERITYHRRILKGSNRALDEAWDTICDKVATSVALYQKGDNKAYQNELKEAYQLLAALTYAQADARKCILGMNFPDWKPGYEIVSERFKLSVLKPRHEITELFDKWESELSFTLKTHITHLHPPPKTLSFNSEIDQDIFFPEHAPAFSFSQENCARFLTDFEVIPTAIPNENSDWTNNLTFPSSMMRPPSHDDIPK